MTSSWFALAPVESTVQRITLDFRLRGPNLHFQELVVPGVGGVRFVRQLTWALAGIAMRNRVGGALRATVIANAIEALGCKAELIAGDDEDISPRVLGRRAFRRDGPDVAAFRQLSQREHYVQNTFRATATRVLRNDVGLGLATGPRFDVLELTPVGDQLVKALLDSGQLGRGGARLGSWLAAWINGEKIPSWAALREALSPDKPTTDEQRLVRARLLDVDGPAGSRRRTLASVLKGSTVPDVEGVIAALHAGGHTAYADDVVLAQSFGVLLDACIGVVEEISVRLEQAGSLPLPAAAKAAVKQLQAVKKAGERYLALHERVGTGHPEAASFARVAKAFDDSALLSELIRREGRVVDVLDGDVHKGALYRNLRSSSDDDDEEDADGAARERTFRLASFHELLRDTRGGGA